MLTSTKLVALAFVVATASLFAQAPGQGRNRGQNQNQERADPHRIDQFVCDWRESMPRQTHGGLVERDILTHGDPQTSTKRCAVLAVANRLSYATLAARARVAPMKLDGEQEILYVVSGKGTVTSGGQTSELHDGIALLLPAGVEFSMTNTGDADINMYVINETLPAGFRPGAKMLVKDMNLEPVRSTTGHWVHIVKNVFAAADGLATMRNALIVSVDPMTVPEPHEHTTGQEEVWVQIKGKSLLFLGTQLRWQNEGVGYLAPPFAEGTRANITAGRAFPHSNINPGDEQVKFLYFRSLDQPAAGGTASASAR